jgi:hypothetical protein
MGTHPMTCNLLLYFHRPSEFLSIFKRWPAFLSRSLFILLGLRFLVLVNLCLQLAFQAGLVYTTLHSFA